MYISLYFTAVHTHKCFYSWIEIQVQDTTITDTSLSAALCFQYSLSRLKLVGLDPGLTFNVRVDSVTTTMMDDVCMNRAQADGSSVSRIYVHHTTQLPFMG